MAVEINKKIVITSETERRIAKDLMECRIVPGDWSLGDSLSYVTNFTNLIKKHFVEYLKFIKRVEPRLKKSHATQYYLYFKENETVHEIIFEIHKETNETLILELRGCSFNVEDDLDYPFGIGSWSEIWTDIESFCNLPVKVCEGKDGTLRAFVC